MAALRGCRVLGIGGFAGSVEPGKVAGFAGFGVDTLEFARVKDPDLDYIVDKEIQRDIKEGPRGSTIS